MQLADVESLFREQLKSQMINVIVKFEFVELFLVELALIKSDYMISINLNQELMRDF